MEEFLTPALNLFQRNRNNDNFMINKNVHISDKKLNVKSLLAVGGFSYVYLAKDGEGQEFALKKVTGQDKESCDRILKEIEIHKKLQNKFILKLEGVSYVYKSDSNVAEYLLLTQFCPYSMVEIVKKELTLSTISTLMFQAASAIHYLHNNSPTLIHRDIKLENFLISQNGILQLCDFGSATTNIVTPDENWDLHKRQNVQEELFTCTSPMYRAPEIVDIWCNFPIGPKVDIWALGCVFFCLIHKMHPFEDASILKIVNGNYVIPDTNDLKCFDELLHSCFVVNPKNRTDIKSLTFNLKCKINQLFGEKLVGINLERIDLLDIFKDSFTINPKDQKDYFLKSSELLSSIKGSANTLFNNIKKAVGQNQTTSKLNIYKLTEKIMISYENNVEVITQYLANISEYCHISVYNFSSINLKFLPPVRYIGSKNIKNNYLSLENMFTLAEEMFGWLSANSKNILILQDDISSNKSAIILCNLMLYAQLTYNYEDALQIYSLRVGQTSLSCSDFRYLSYFESISKKKCPQSKSVLINKIDFKNIQNLKTNLINFSFKIFENGALTFEKNFPSFFNSIKNIEIFPNKSFFGNILFLINFEDVSLKTSSNKHILQFYFHSGFLLPGHTKFDVEMDDLDVINETKVDLSFSVQFNLQTHENKTYDKSWASTYLKKNPQVLFKSESEYKEISENYVLLDNEKEKNGEDLLNINSEDLLCSPVKENYKPIRNKLSKKEEKQFIDNNLVKESINMEKIENQLKNSIIFEENILQEACFDQKPFFELEEKKELREDNNLNNFDLLNLGDINTVEIPKYIADCNPFFDQVSENVTNTNSNYPIKYDEVISVDDNLLEFCQKSDDLFENSFLSDNKNFVSEKKVNDFKVPPNTNNIKLSDEKRNTDFFADLLGQQGYQFAPKKEQENKTINDMRNQEIVKNMNEENKIIFNWTKGKKCNIRALLCSLHTIMWENSKWNQCEMHNLITAADVRKAYKKACLAVHPDKHVGTDKEIISKMIFMELNNAWSIFSSENGL